MSDQREGGIGWTDQTWNPVRGCSRVSPGCEHCYAETMSGRFCGPGQPYEGLVVPRGGVIKMGSHPAHDRIAARARWTGEVRLVPEHLADPLRWKRPRRVFVNSMSDLFHEGLSNEEIAAVFGVMAAAPTHTFQVLTKRAERMRDWFAWVDRHGKAVVHPTSICSAHANDALGMLGLRTSFGRASDVDTLLSTDHRWPQSNVWLGVSVESQKYADERIPWLLETPAAVRFVSAEPLLGPIDLAEYLDPATAPCGETEATLDWIIVGCESGPGARPTHPDWYRSLRNQCETAGVPFFLKQATASEPPCSCGHTWKDHNEFEGCCRDCLCTASLAITTGPGSKVKAGGVIAAPYLDGRQWLEFPR